MIDEWLLLEYAVCFLPMNQDALVESVSKGAVELPDAFLAALGLDRSLFAAPRPAPLPRRSAVHGAGRGGEGGRAASGRLRPAGAGPEGRRRAL